MRPHAIENGGGSKHGNGGHQSGTGDAHENPLKSLVMANTATNLAELCGAANATPGALQVQAMWWPYLQFKGRRSWCYNHAMLDAEELERYARHIVLREVGGPGQPRLKRARVLVVGAGGLGAPVLLYLAAAGVGTLGVVDDDTVSLSNLQRQVIHGTPDVGMPKVESAAATIGRLNPHVAVEAHPTRLTAANVARSGRTLRHRRRWLRQFRDALSGIRCLLPRAQAAGDRGHGHVRRHADDHPRARARPRRPPQSDLPLPVPRAAAAGHGPRLRQAGVLGAMAGVLGSLMALEVIREIVGFGEGLVGRLLMIDTRAMRFETLRYGWDPGNPLSGETPTIGDLSIHA